MQNEYPISDLARIFPDMPPEDFFHPFYRCAVDPARIEIDERVVRDLLGLGEDAVASVARLRTLLASEPSIHGSKQSEVPS